MPLLGQKAKYLDCSITCKKSKFLVRVPRAVSITGREWTVDRVHGTDKEAAYAGCLKKIESMVASNSERSS